MNPTPTNEPTPVSLSYPDKLAQEEIIVPDVNFQATNIADAVEYLSWQARRYDHEEKCDYRRGVPICYAVSRLHVSVPPGDHDLQGLRFARRAARRG